MLKFLTSRAAVLGSTILAGALAFAAVNPAIYGKWASVQDMGGMKYTLALDIGQTQSSLTVTCAQNGKSATAHVTVPTQVTESQLILKGSASDSKKLGDLDCSVEVVPMAFDYQLQGNEGMMLSAQGQTVPFQRVK